MAVCAVLSRHIQCFAHQSLRDAKAISGESVKAYLWFPGLLSPFFPLFGPESLGGKGNIRVKAEEEARRTGREPVDIALEVGGICVTSCR